MKHRTDPEETLFLETLREGAVRLGIDLDREGTERILTHRRVLLKWSLKMNLTTVRDPQGMAELLYLDSLVLLPHLGTGSVLHDIGSGAGFPGLVLKAVRPGLELVLTEARQKKVSFLKQAAREMQLADKLKICRCRLGHDPVPAPGAWSEVVSRAAFPPEEWIRLGTPLVGSGGRLWIFAGQPSTGSENPKRELNRLLENLPEGFEPEDRHTYHLARTAKDRMLLSLRRAC